ncbi:HNH endonuclease family protein [Streptomyces sp. YGL11-2]|uniref:HNH endonuclease family protein n=1 Tax=Streptomyces sp. YGL11-2 TaxID=3414028 RepID=UPI003CF8557F
MFRARRLAVLACPLLLLSTAACSHTDSDDAKPPASSHRNPADGKRNRLSLTDAISRLRTAPESRAGYTRTKFRLWTDADHNGCDTRQEVLLSEAVKKPKEGKGCKLTGGTWHSYYDDQTVTDARGLDIDHVVPLAEAWDSGASKWTAKRREQYANDLGAERSLTAVSSGPNRAKGDKDPAEWMPPARNAACTYASDWVATKLRWNLTADRAEKKALSKIAAGCAQAAVRYSPAP